MKRSSHRRKSSPTIHRLRQLLGLRPASDAAPSQRYRAPHQPWPKQRTFLELTCLEAFFGGAAGGGKSDALLTAALEHVHIPGYAALILRKDTQRLKLAGGLIPRSHEWLAGTGAKWHGGERAWTFPTAGAPATLRFGYLSDAQDKYRYASSEFQFIAFDELTEFPEEDYLFLFSRLRRTRNLAVPLRMRSASNPGGQGHAWVKARFIPPDHKPSARALDSVLWNNSIAYVPATIDDNPALDADQYRASLRHLPPLTRERLMNGDWSLREDGLLRPDWLRTFSPAEDREAWDLFAHDGRRLGAISMHRVRRFVTIDPAGTSEDRARERRGRAPSWSAIQVWDHAIGGGVPALLLRSAWRGRVGFEDLCRTIRETHEQWRPDRLWIENEKLGQAAVDVLGRHIPLGCVPTGGRDKVSRAAWLITRLERGEIFLPRAPLLWKEAFEAELLAWTGAPDETSDQVDAAAYAALLADRTSAEILQMQPVIQGSITGIALR